MLRIRARSRSRAKSCVAEKASYLHPRSVFSLLPVVLDKLFKEARPPIVIEPLLSAGAALAVSVEVLKRDIGRLDGEGVKVNG